MNRKYSFFLKTSSALLLLFFFCSAVFGAADDQNPDSPTPVLLSETDTTRVLAVEAGNWNGNLPKTAQKAFRVGQKSVVTLFVTNLDLLEGEGANAFRVYLNHRNGRTYQLSVEELTSVSRTIYALRVRLFDPSNYRGQPPADGDALIYLTWRGLASNQLKIGLGKTGGDLRIPDALNFNTSKSSQPTAELVGYRWSGDRKRFLEQATFGPSPELDARIRRIGLRTWLAEQFQAPYPTIPYPNIPLMPTTPPSDCNAASFPHCFRERYSMQPVQQWFFKEAFYGNAQLRHRVAWALSQIWVTSGVSIKQSSHMIAYHKVLSENAFGNYRTLMEKVTLNPAMGDYLDMVRSVRGNPNENYAREILQLFSIGLYRMNQDGTLQLDGQGNPIPTYNQDTINDFAKVFTGWTYCNLNNAATCPNFALGTLNYKDPMRLVPVEHDVTAKTLLSYPNAVHQNIPACVNCDLQEEIDEYAYVSFHHALDNIFNHPNVAPFVSKLLIQHLVTSDPSPAYVGRVAAVFNNNGLNVRGDLKAVVTAILLDPEARGNIKTDPVYGKLREPVQLLTNLARLYPAKSFNGEEPSDGGLNETMKGMGQSPFYSPSVFNYYPPDYVVPGTNWVAPEFNLLNTGTGIKRINTLYILIFEGITPNATDSLKGTSIDISEIAAYAAADASGNQLLDALNSKMLHGTLTPEQRSLILNAVTVIPASDAVLRAKTAIYLIAASSQYQVQR